MEDSEEEDMKKELTVENSFIGIAVNQGISDNFQLWLLGFKVNVLKFYEG